MDGADGADTFVLDWLENGGPGAEAGEKQGFGLKFIERSIAYELQGTAELRFDPGGLHVRIRAPMSEVTGAPGLQ